MVAGKVKLSSMHSKTVNHRGRVFEIRAAAIDKGLGC